MIDPQPLLDKYCPEYTYKIIYAGENYYGETFPDEKLIELTQHWEELNPEGQRYVLLHEICHARYPDDGHSREFWDRLETLVFEEEINPIEAYLLETFAPEWYLRDYAHHAWKRMLEMAS